MNISLTDDLKAFFDSRVKSRGYSSSSEYERIRANTCEYVRNLLRRDEEKLKEEHFQKLIQDRLESPLDPRSWEEIWDGWSQKTELARMALTQKSL